MKFVDTHFPSNRSVKGSVFTGSESDVYFTCRRHVTRLPADCTAVGGVWNIFFPSKNSLAASQKVAEGKNKN